MGWKKHCRHRDARWHEQRFQVSAAEREQAHRRSPLSRKVTATCRRATCLASGVWHPLKRQRMQMSCISVLWTVQLKKAHRVQRTNLFSRALPSHCCLVFTEERYFLSKRKQVLRKDLFLQRGETAGRVAFAQPLFAWFRKPSSQRSCLRRATLPKPSLAGWWACSQLYLPQGEPGCTHGHVRACTHVHGLSPLLTLSWELRADRR